MDKSEASRNFFGFVGIIAIVLVVVSVGSAFLFGMSEGYDDQEVIDEYNEYIDTWNRDMDAYTIYLDIANAALNDYNNEVEIYNNAYFSDGKSLDVAEDRLRDAQLEYKYNAMIIKGRLEMFRTFLYTNQNILERNGVDVLANLNGINEWIAEIDYNVQFAGI